MMHCSIIHFKKSSFTTQKEILKPEVTTRFNSFKVRAYYKPVQWYKISYGIGRFEMLFSCCFQTS